MNNEQKIKEEEQAIEMTDAAVRDVNLFENIIKFGEDVPKMTEPLLSAIDKERALLIDSFFNLVGSLDKDRIELIDEVVKILGGLDKERVGLTDEFFRSISELNDGRQELIDEFFEGMSEMVAEFNKGKEEAEHTSVPGTSTTNISNVMIDKKKEEKIS